MENSARGRRFGTDERYLPYIVQFKSDGFIGVVDIGFRREIRSIEEAPEYLRPSSSVIRSLMRSAPYGPLHGSLISRYVRQRTDRLECQDENCLGYAWLP
jgi:hypothetical protein